MATGITDTWAGEGISPALAASGWETGAVPNEGDLPKLRLRFATPDDAAALADVQIAAWRAGYQDVVPDALGSATREQRRAFWHHLLTAAGEHEVVVAERPAGSVIGFARFGPADDGPADEPGAGAVSACIVHPDHWRTGTGVALLRAARRLLRARGFRTARLWVLDGDERAIGLTRADGWAPDGTTRDEVEADVPVRTARWVRSLQDEPYLVANRQTWDRWAGEYAEWAPRAWESEPSWGLFSIPDEQVGVFRDDDLRGLDVVELGCGTGYISAWCLRAGARRAVGVDNSPAQLATAAAMARRYDRPLQLVLADAEHAPLASASFDLVISEYGAAIWCDPYRWIPEAARLLRLGGKLVFLGNSVLVTLCVPEFDGQAAGPSLRRPQRGMHRFEWPDTAAVEFHVSHGELVRILRGAGFEVLDLIELHADEGAETNYEFVDGWWASRWPVEEVWIARKR